MTMRDNVDHPDHYGGKDNPYEAIKVIDAWELDFCLGNAVKYIARAGKKDNNSKEQDLRKALWYIQHEIDGCKADSADGERIADTARICPACGSEILVEDVSPMDRKRFLIRCSNPECKPLECGGQMFSAIATVDILPYEYDEQDAHLDRAVNDYIRRVNSDIKAKEKIEVLERLVDECDGTLRRLAE